MNDLDHRQTIRAMLESAGLSPKDVESHRGRALDRQYWRELNPELSVEGHQNRPLAAMEASALTPEEIGALAAKLQREGYFQSGPVLDPVLVNRLRSAIENVRANGWPAVFSWVYDEFWQAVRTPSLVQLVETFLGEGYLQNALIWTYYVAPIRGASGWPPHSDSTDHDVHLTVWVPLTEATIENGCMYIIPGDRMPKDIPRVYRELTTVTKPQLSALLQSTKALPSPPGALLGWNHETIHWGSVSSGQKTPRISIAVEFIAREKRARSHEGPFFEATRTPGFEDRIRAIGKGLLDYGRFEPAAARFEELGRQLQRT